MGRGTGTKTSQQTGLGTKRRSKTMYHVTAQKSRTDIELKGLLIPTKEDSPWGDFDPSVAGVYLWDDRDIAQRYADELLLDSSDIWEVDVTGITIIADPSIEPGHAEYGSEWQEHAYYSATPIPAANIKKVGMDWDSENRLDLENNE